MPSRVGMGIGENMTYSDEVRDSSGKDILFVRISVFGYGDRDGNIWSFLT
jgi:hypothetical protein